MAKPARSFCPRCSQPISWKNNIPVLSYIFLRGRCASCSQSIPFRYPLVEALTAALFAGVVLHSAPFAGASLFEILSHWTLFSLLIAASFIDWDHLIIPDSISLGGVVLGVAFGALEPPIHGAGHWMQGAGMAILGAAAGYGALWSVAEGGRFLFGKVRLNFDAPHEVIWKRDEGEPVLQVGEDQLFWGELFFRDGQKVIMQVADGVCAGEAIPPGRWEWTVGRLRAGDREFELDSLDRVEFRVHQMILPREVMGYGDVKLLAAIGSFLGWKSVLFVMTAGASLGALAGGLCGVFGRRDWASRIPFGPYLAAGAVWWVFGGDATLRLYWRAMDWIRF